MFNKNFTPLTLNTTSNTSAPSYATPEIEPSPNESGLQNKEKFEYGERINTEPEESPSQISFTDKDKAFKLHPDLKKAGLQAIEPSSLDKKHIINLPLPDEVIISSLKKPPTSSARWIAEYAILLLKKAHIALKIVHGKVVRIIKK